MPIEIAGNTYNPAICLAPMEDVTDSAFRRLCKELGADILYTEFISSEALIRDAVKAHKKLFIHENEHPLGIQLYGSRLQPLLDSGKIAVEVKPDFIDLNVGCPVTKVADQGMGAGLLKDCDLLSTVVKGLVKTIPLPVTVKTRLGWDDSNINILENIKMLSQLGIKWIAIHARTRAQAYKGKANWEYIKKAKELDLLPVIGNGDITSLEDAEKALEYSKCDGIMIGRGAIKKPWLFKQLKAYFRDGIRLPEPEFEEKIEYAKKHLEYLSEQQDSRMVARKFIRFNSTYFSGIKNIAKIRQKLSTCRSGEEMLEIVENVGKLVNW